jgi:hypothetical protein
MYLCGIIKRDKKTNLNLNIMEKYDYYQAVSQDVDNVIAEEQETLSQFTNIDDLHDYICQMCCDCVAVYTWTAEENLCHNWALLAEAAEAFGCTNITGKSAVELDSLIRCYVLDTVLEEKFDRLHSKEEEEKAEQ